MRPPFSYYGGKNGMAGRIIELMPPHRVYMETHFGSGAVLFHKRPVPMEVANDIDGSVVAFFRVLRDRPDELERVCRLTPYHRGEFADAYDAGVVVDELEVARRFWVRVNQSFAKTAGRQTGWSVTTARTQSVAASVQGRIDRFMACAERLSQVVFEQCDAPDLVARLATADTVIFADPPYLAETRRGRDRQRPADYLHDMGDAEGHERLAAALHATPATVLLCGYHSPLYDELYGDWWRLEVPVLVHASNSVTASRGERTEVVWSNRDLDAGRLLFG